MHEQVFSLDAGTWFEVNLSFSANPDALRSGCLLVTATAPVFVMGHVFFNQPSRSEYIETLSFFPIAW